MTPYTAPELLEGRSADAGGDVFAYGANFCQLLTGRRAFAGDGPAELAAAIRACDPPPTGNPALDRVIATCLAKDPAARYQRMQKLILELKLLTAVARRESLAAGRGEHVAAMLRAEIQSLETRLAARLQAHEQKIAEMQTASVAAADAAAELQEQTDDGLRQTIAALDTRVAVLEQGAGRIDSDLAALRGSFAADLETCDRLLKSQGAAIESAHTALGQTDDLVERVVEALDTLESMVLERGGAV